MTRYLDASVLIPVLVEEGASEAVDAYLAAHAEALVISDFASAEVASALSRLVRTGALDPQDAAERLADFDLWRAAATQTVDVVAADVRLANAYVRRFELMLRAPDALHLAVSARLGMTLATLDRRLLAAARALGVEAESP